MNIKKHTKRVIYEKTVIQVMVTKFQFTIFISFAELFA